MVRCAKLRNIFDEDAIDLTLKLRLYDASVCSVLTFGCETWNLDQVTIKFLNGANSRILSRFTCKSIFQEARPATTSFNLENSRTSPQVGQSYTKMWSFQDHIQSPCGLRETWLTKVIYTVFTDVPPHTSMKTLTEMAMDRAAWSEYVNAIPHFYWVMWLLICYLKIDSFRLVLTTTKCMNEKKQSRLSSKSQCMSYWYFSEIFMININGRNWLIAIYHNRFIFHLIKHFEKILCSHWVWIFWVTSHEMSHDVNYG